MAYDSAVGVCSVSMASSHERRLAARPVQHVVTHRKKKKDRFTRVFLYSCITMHCTNDYEDGAVSGPGAAGLDSCVLESVSVAIRDDAAAGSALSCMRVS